MVKWNVAEGRGSFGEQGAARTPPAHALALREPDEG